MRLGMVALRSYRSFNYDYRKKLASSPEAFPQCRKPWEEESDYDSWRPWVVVPIHAPITCIVGANEAGKTHLMDALWKAATNEELRREDVCRYSEEFLLTNRGDARLAAQWLDLPERALSLLGGLAVEDSQGSSEQSAEEATHPSLGLKEIDSVVVTRKGNDPPEVLLLAATGEARACVKLGDSHFDELMRELPRPVRVTPRTFLPSAVHLSTLFRIALEGASDELVNSFLKTFDQRFFPNRKGFLAHQVSPSDHLVYRLLHRCLGLDYDVLRDIAEAPEQVLKGYSKQASDRAEELLNLAYWWGQDVDAHLQIDLRRDEGVLNLTDRTQEWYGFAERSQGMRYFLGYLIQILLELSDDKRPLLILSDEPDFALSAVGQRDLLRFFRRVVREQREGGHCQIVLTTHSAELIDPNYPDRVTVLRKGLFDEGTVVVHRTLHRLFEPVRSALGGKACPIPFIDGPNLVVEGIADQAFFTRMSQYLAKREQQHLDLANLSIVVAEGCSRMGKVVSWAGALAGDRAYLTVILDSDEYGRRAATELEGLDPYLREHEQIVMMDQVCEPGIGKDVELEDIVPLGIIHGALENLVRETWGDEAAHALPSCQDFSSSCGQEPVLSTIERALSTLPISEAERSLDKLALVDHVFDLMESGTLDAADIATFESTMGKLTGLLLDRVNENLRCKREGEVRRSMTVRIRAFAHANPVEATNAAALELLQELRELGNRVSPPLAFDTEVNAVISDFSLLKGLRSDLLVDHSQFLDRVRVLPQRLTVDPALVLMTGR